MIREPEQAGPNVISFTNYSFSRKTVRNSSASFSQALTGSLKQHYTTASISVAYVHIVHCARKRRDML